MYVVVELFASVVLVVVLAVSRDESVEAEESSVTSWIVSSGARVNVWAVVPEASIVESVDKLEVPPVVARDFVVVGEVDGLALDGVVELVTGIVELGLVESSEAPLAVAEGDRVGPPDDELLSDVALVVSVVELAVDGDEIAVGARVVIVADVVVSGELASVASPPGMLFGAVVVAAGVPVGVSVGISVGVSVIVDAEEPLLGAIESSLPSSDPDSAAVVSLPSSSFS